jgi:tetratricopeptide (TPR) repeat protein
MNGTAMTQFAQRTSTRAAWVPCLPLFLLLATLPLRGQVVPAAFEAANRLYEEGKFADAASSYEKLIPSGHASAALLFNLGNAWFKSGQIGRAIVAYRKAEELTPRDPDVRANLQFARNQAQGPTYAPKRWQRWLASLTLNEWTLLAAAALWVLLVKLALLQWRPALRAPLAKAIVVLGVVTVLLGICLAMAWRQTRSIRIAVVVTAEAVVRHGPLDESQAAFTAHDGAELRVADQKDDWLQVAASSRQIGWLRRHQVVLLHDQ